MLRAFHSTPDHPPAWLIFRRASQAKSQTMSVKDIVYRQHARAKILNGVNTLANAVKVTLGPRGRNVLIERVFGGPIVTKDGVTVAKEIEIEPKLDNMGAQMVI